jgi:hypothetical protein
MLSLPTDEADPGPGLVRGPHGLQLARAIAAGRVNGGVSASGLIRTPVGRLAPGAEEGLQVQAFPTSG